MKRDIIMKFMRHTVMSAVILSFLSIIISCPVEIIAAPTVIEDTTRDGGIINLGEVTLLYDRVRVVKGKTTFEEPRWVTSDASSTQTTIFSQSVEYRLEDDAPLGLSIDEDTGEVTYNAPATPQALSKYTVIATGINAYIGEQRTELEIEVTEHQLSGDLSYPDINIELGSSGTINPVWTPALSSNHTLEYDIVPSVNGITINSSTGVISISESTEVLSSAFTVIATGTGNYSGEITAQTNISVTVDNPIKGTFSYADRTVLEKTNSSSRLTWNGADSGQTVIYILTTSVPGITINANTGTLSIASTTNAGTHNLVVHAHGYGEYSGVITTTAKVIVQLDVSKITFSYPVQTTTQADLLAGTLYLFSNKAEAKGPTPSVTLPTGAVTYSTATTLPTGMELNPTTGAIVSKAGQNTFKGNMTVTMTGNGSTHVGSKSITVPVHAAIDMVSYFAGTKLGPNNTNYLISGKSTNGTISPVYPNGVSFDSSKLEYKKSSGTLPAGVTMDSSGNLTVDKNANGAVFRSLGVGIYPKDGVDDYLSVYTITQGTLIGVKRSIEGYQVVYIGSSGQSNVYRTYAVSAPLLSALPTLDAGTYQFSNTSVPSTLSFNTTTGAISGPITTPVSASGSYTTTISVPGTSQLFTGTLTATAVINIQKRSIYGETMLIKSGNTDVTNQIVAWSLPAATGYEYTTDISGFADDDDEVTYTCEVYNFGATNYMACSTLQITIDANGRLVVNKNMNTSYNTNAIRITATAKTNGNYNGSVSGILRFSFTFSGAGSGL